MALMKALGSKREMPLHVVLIQLKQMNDVASSVEGLGPSLAKWDKGSLHGKWHKGARGFVYKMG
jgi:hypothetical protein